MKTEAKEVLKEIQKTSHSVRSEVETIKSVVDKTYNIVVDHHYKVSKEIAKSMPFAYETPKLNEKL